MKITVSRQELQAALSALAKVSGLASLENVRLVAFDGAVELTAIGESRLRLSVQCKTDDNGVAIANCAALRDIVKTASGVQITIQALGKIIKIQGAAARWSIPRVPEDEWIEFGQPKATLLAGRAKVASWRLAKLLADVKHAASIDSKDSAVLGGVCLMVDRDTMVASATDRFRLAQSTAEATEGDLTAIIPLSQIGPLVAALKTSTGEASLTMRGGWLCVDSSHAVIDICCADGVASDLAPVLAQKSSGSALFDRRDLMSGLKMAILMSTRDQMVTLGGALHEYSVTSENHDGGRCEYTLVPDCEITEKVKANGQFMIDALGSLYGEQARLRFSGSHGPVLIDCPGDESSIRAVMPHGGAV